MKKLIPFILVLVLFVVVMPVHAESGNWIALRSDNTSITAPGQTMLVTVDASMDTALNGAGVVFNYDPACLKVIEYRPGSLLPNAVAFEQNVPGSLDLTYYYQGASQAITGEGSLMEISFEVLDLTNTAVTINPDLVVLDRIDETGMAVGLPNVEVQNLAVQAVVNTEAASLVDEPASQIAASPSLSEPPAVAIPTSAVQALNPPISELPFDGLAFLLIGAALIFASLLIVILVVVLIQKPAKISRGHSSSGRKLDVPTLIVETGPQKGKVFVLQGKHTVFGRQNSCQIKTDNHFISRQHAEIVRHDGNYYLTDFGSRNGTFLNRKKLNSGHYLINDGDTIRLGEEITYRFAAPYKPAR